jgi:hypothetical protein
LQTSHQLVAVVVAVMMLQLYWVQMVVLGVVAQAVQPGQPHLEVRELQVKEMQAEVLMELTCLAAAVAALVLLDATRLVLVHLMAGVLEGMVLQALLTDL